jgi:hypothetical protein
LVTVSGARGDGPVAPVWKERLTYVAMAPESRMLGTLTVGERLTGVRIRCPRCDAPKALLWRRFDYFGRERPIYFTKCTKCFRRTQLEAAEAAFRLVEVGIIDPMRLVDDKRQVGDAGNRTQGDEDGPGAVETAQMLVTNRERAFGRKHPLTFAARGQLSDAVGRNGDTTGAVRMYQQLLVDEEARLGSSHPSVLSNRYELAIWTARDGHPMPALVSLRTLCADQQRVLGADHPNTLSTRASIAELTDATGDREEAVTLLHEVSNDLVRVLGREHPITESVLSTLAEWEGR